MQLITSQEAQALVNARRILKDVAERAQTNGISYLIDGRLEEYPDADAYDFGMVNQAARTAEWDVFSALNIMQNHVHDEVADVTLSGGA